MNSLLILEVVSHLAAIATGAVAVVAYTLYQWDRRSKRLRLEEHLRKEKAAGTDQGQRTLLHLVALLGMSETEIMDAAFRSGVIARRVSVDERGRSTLMYLEYEGKDIPTPKRF